MADANDGKKGRPVAKWLFGIAGSVIAGVVGWILIHNVLENTAPQAFADEYVVAAGDELVVGDATARDPQGVLENDTDADRDSLQAFLVTGVANGRLWLDRTTGSFTYTPDPLFMGTDTFTYKASDGRKESGQVDVTIRVEGAAPVARFAESVVEGFAPLQVSFTDQSGRIPTEWLWDFGDGTRSTERNPTHTYSEVSYQYAGLDLETDDTECFVCTSPFTVTLTASNAAGTASVTKSELIRVKPKVVSISLQAVPNSLTEHAVQANPRSSSLCGARALGGQSLDSGSLSSPPLRTDTSTGIPRVTSVPLTLGANALTEGGSYLELQKIGVQARHELTVDGETWRFEDWNVTGVDSLPADRRLPDGDHYLVLELTRSATIMAHYRRVN